MSVHSRCIVSTVGVIPKRRIVLFLVVVALSPDSALIAADLPDVPDEARAISTASVASGVRSLPSCQSVQSKRRFW